MSETWIDRAQQRLDQLDITPEGASKAAGLSRGYLRGAMALGRSPRGDTMLRLARALKCRAPWLLTGELPVETGSEAPPSPPLAARGRRAAPRPHELPVLGSAAGSVLGTLQIGEPVEFVYCPPGLERVEGAYALRVTGTSMSPRFEHGDVIYVHPHREPVAGDYVVVQEREAAGRGVIAYVKQLSRVEDGSIVCRQHNPPAEVSFRRAAVLALHRVLTTNELLRV